MPWPLLKASLEPLPQTIQSQVDKAKEYGFEGMIVYIDQARKDPQFYTSGYKNRETKSPANPHDLFKIASIGKLYTAFAICRLAYDEKLDLNQSLAQYFPEHKGRIENMEEITIEMLVKHRSGIPDYTRTADYWSHPKQTDEERLALVLDQTAHFKPNTDFEYSNTNYLLLSQLIEKVSGKSKFEFLKEELLQPLNLNNTFGSIKSVDLNNVMSGYYVGYDLDLKTDDNGSLLATAEDLGRFIRALNDGRAFKSEEERALYHSLYRLNHTGMIPGYQSTAHYFQELDAVVVQFTNTADFNAYHWSFHEIMFNRIVKILKAKVKSE